MTSKKSMSKPEAPHRGPCPTRAIYVIDSGWVMIAESCEDDAASLYVRLKDASVIREWGTEYGLGQIALRGPTPKTIFDAVGNPVVHRSKLQFIVPCIYDAV